MRLKVLVCILVMAFRFAAPVQSQKIPEQSVASILAKALQSADTITDPMAKVLVLQEIGQTQVEAGDCATGIATLQKAHALTPSIKNQQTDLLQGQILRGIANAQRLSGELKSAVETLGRTPDFGSENDLRHPVLLSLTEQIQKGKADDLIQTVLAAPTLTNRVALLNLLALSLTRKGSREEGKTLLEKSLLMADAAPDSEEKLSALLSIAGMQARAGHLERGRETAKKAREIGDTSPALEKARKNPLFALAFLEFVKDDFASLHEARARELLATGDLAGAETIVEAMKGKQQGILRTALMKQKLLAKARMESAEQVLALAQQPANKPLQSSLRRIASEKQIGAKAWKQALETIVQTRLEMQNPEDPDRFDRESLLLALVQALVKADDLTGAKAISQIIEMGPVRGEAVGSIVLALMRAGNMAAVQKIVPIPNTEQDAEELHLFLLHTIAVEQAKRGEIADGLKTAEAIHPTGVPETKPDIEADLSVFYGETPAFAASPSVQKAMTLMDMAQARAAAGDVTGATALAEKLTDRGWKARTYRHIALGMIQKKITKKA